MSHFVEKLPTNQNIVGHFLYYLATNKYTKKAMSAIYVWKKAEQVATPGYICYLSRNTVLEKLGDLYDMLKRAEDPKADVKHQERWHLCIDKLFDLSKKDVDKYLFVKDYLF